MGGQTVKILYEDKKIPGTDWKSFILQFGKREKGSYIYEGKLLPKINEKAATSQDKIP